MTFSHAIVAFDIKMHSNSVPKKFCRSRSFGDFGLSSLVSCLSTFSKDFSSENTGPILFKFHMQPSGKGGKSIYIWARSHDQLAAKPMYRNNLKMLFSRTTGLIVFNHGM